MAKEQITNECPYCHGPMTVAQMACRQCNVSIAADFPPQRLGNLPIEHQRFIEMFVLAGGSLKEIAAQTGVSYPTVRSRLDKVIESLRAEIAQIRDPRGGSVKTLDDPLQNAELAARLIKNI